jgi:rubrerythrin
MPTSRQIAYLQTSIVPIQLTGGTLKKDANDTNNSPKYRKRKHPSAQKPISEDEVLQITKTLKDCHEFINKAEAEHRISTPKATRLRHCLQSTSLTETIFQLLAEQIPSKRPTSKTKGGYQCKICLEPLKGHLCPYCPVCSTPEMRYAKDGGHSCFNCVQCFELGKKRKKLVQVRIGDGSCAHGKNGAAVVLVSMKQGALEK